MSGLVPDSLTPTPAAFAAANPQLVRQIWSNTAIASARMADTVYDKQQGNVISTNPIAGQRIIAFNQDLSKGEGQEVTYTLTREIYRKGIKGSTNTLFSDQAQYNEVTYGYDKVRVGLKRESLKTNRYKDEVMGFKEDMMGDKKIELLGRLWGRNVQRDLMMTTLHCAGSENRFYAGGKSSLNNLTGADTLKGADLTIAQSILTTQLGATPAAIRLDGNGNNVYGFHTITTGESYGQLKLDPDIQKALQLAGQRDDTNPLFAGGLKHWDGQSIQWIAAINHVDAGEVGCPFSPFAMLGKPIGTNNQETGTTTTEAICGGRNATFADDLEVEYMKDFPSTSYTFLNGTVLGASQTPGPYYTNNDFWGYRTGDETAWDAAPYFYVVISNPKNAQIQPGKWAIFKITQAANNQNRFTAIAERLGPTVSGIQNTTVGAVEWDPAVHGTYFGAEASIMLTNSAGVPIMASPMHGAAALHRAFGSYREWTDTENYQQIARLIYMSNIAGHGLRRDPSFRATGIMNVVHATRYYHVNHG